MSSSTPLRENESPWNRLGIGEMRKLLAAPQALPGIPRPGIPAAAGPRPCLGWRDAGNPKAATREGLGIYFRCFILEFFESCWEGEVTGWQGLLAELLNSFMSFNASSGTASPFIFLFIFSPRVYCRKLCPEETLQTTFLYSVNLASQSSSGVLFTDLGVWKAHN